MNTQVDELQRLLKPMDIPSFRKDIDKVNLKWLTKNLARKNAEHPNYARAMELVHTILDQKLYTH